MKANGPLLEYFDFDGVKMNMIFEFDDGEVNISIDKDSLTEKFAEIMKNGLKKYFDAHADELGGSLDDILEQSGMSLDDLIDSMMGEVDLFAELDDIERDGYYEVDDDLIYLADDEDELGDEEDYIKCTVQGKKKIKIVEWVDDGDEIKKLSDFLPVIMKKN